MACQPTVKLTKAKVLKYAATGQKNSTSDGIEDRVTQLRGELAQAHTNINVLRTWVDEAMNEVEGKKPLSPQEIVDEIRALLVKLDKFDDFNEVMIDRGQECIRMMDEVGDQSCLCSLTSPSSENIKKQLQEVVMEMDAIDTKLSQQQEDKGPCECAAIANKAQKELAEVVQACSALCSPKKKSEPQCPTTCTTNTMPSNRDSASKRPKLSQTVEKNLNADQGTNACCDKPCCR